MKQNDARVCARMQWVAVILLAGCAQPTTIDGPVAQRISVQEAHEQCEAEILPDMLELFHAQMNSVDDVADALADLDMPESESEKLRSGAIDQFVANFRARIEFCVASKTLSREEFGEFIRDAFGDEQ